MPASANPGSVNAGSISTVPLAAAWAVYGVLAVLQLIAQATGQHVLAVGTQVAAMPTLVLVVVLAGVGAAPLKSWMLAALAFSWVGDTLPKLVAGQFEYAAMIGGFLAAQLCWIAALWGLRRRSLVITARWQLPLYVILGTVIVAGCAPAAAGLAPAVLAYGVIVIAMAIMASGLGTVGQLGGLIFVISDGLIAVDRFTSWTIPYAGVWIMATYLVAQATLVAAALANLRQPERA